jgi:hypothetical protein
MQKVGRYSTAQVRQRTKTWHGPHLLVVAQLAVAVPAQVVVLGAHGVDGDGLAKVVQSQLVRCRWIREPTRMVSALGASRLSNQTYSESFTKPLCTRLNDGAP